MKSKVSRPLSQNAIGRALGLSSSAMVKLRKQGMPVTSIEDAAAWRLENVRPTIHNLDKRMGPGADASPPPKSAAVHASALLEIAAMTLQAGVPIDPMIPTLRTALAAVPGPDRYMMLVPMEVMDILTQDVMDAFDEFATHGPGDMMAFKHSSGIEYLSDAEHQTDEQASKMGDFWIDVAAGLIVPLDPKTGRARP